MILAKYSNTQINRFLSRAFLSRTTCCAELRQRVETRMTPTGHIHTGHASNADAHTDKQRASASCVIVTGARSPELCAVCRFVASMVITLFYAQRSHTLHIFLLCSSRASLASLSNDILKLLSSRNSRQHPSFIRHRV